MLCAAIALATLAFAPAVPVAASTAGAGAAAGKVVQTWVEEWDPVHSCWFRIDAPSGNCGSEVRRPAPEDIVYPLPRYGPFLVLDERVAGVFGITDRATLDHFNAMIADFPDIDQLNFVNAGGTVNDVSNLKLGRIIRASGISTHVPGHGSARSGAVELFLAGVRRTMERGARFAVHSWRDNQGRSPRNFDQHDPVNQLYLAFYMEMGMSHDKAHAFYDMTNSVPHSEALWFGPEEMRQWLDK